MLDFVVLVEGEIVVVRREFVLGNEEAIRLAVVRRDGDIAPYRLASRTIRYHFVVALDDVGDVVLLHRLALLVKGIAVLLHVVEPDIVRTAVVGLLKE